MKTYFSESQMLKIRELIGVVPINEMHNTMFRKGYKKDLYFSTSQISRCILLNPAYFMKEFTGVSLGFKNEAYYSEEEMLKETVYDYESLSFEEKKIYESIQ
jgi:hypothetical protein